MIRMLDPKEVETLYDPACGTGGMLLAAVQHVKEQHGDVKRLWGKLFSLNDEGRCAILWPQGVLFRNEEQSMRAKMVELDWVEAVIGLGPNLFYNSPMESCIVVCNRRKPAARKGKVLFIDALNEVTRERAQSFLTPRQQERILSTFRAFSAEAGFSEVATAKQIVAKGANLSIPLYVKRQTATTNADGTDPPTLPAAWAQWQADGRVFWQQMNALVETLDGLDRA